MLTIIILAVIAFVFPRVALLLLAMPAIVVGLLFLIAAIGG